MRRTRRDNRATRIAEVHAHPKCFYLPLFLSDLAISIWLSGSGFICLLLVFLQRRSVLLSHGGCINPANKGIEKEVRPSAFSTSVQGLFSSHFQRSSESLTPLIQVVRWQRREEFRLPEGTIWTTYPYGSFRAPISVRRRGGPSITKTSPTRAAPSAAATLFARGGAQGEPPCRSL